MPDLSPVIEMQIQAQLAYQEYETRGDLNALDVCIQSERLIMDMTEDDDPEKQSGALKDGMPVRFLLDNLFPPVRVALFWKPVCFGRC